MSDYDTRTVAFVAIAAFFIACVTRAIMGSKETLPLDESTKARYVRITRGVPVLQVAEVQIYDESDTNIAPLYGKVSMSSIKHNDTYMYGPNVVVDGNPSGNPMHGEVATTSVDDAEPVIEIDLGYATNIIRLSLYLRDQDLHPNPSSEWIQKHVQDITIQVLSERRQLLWGQSIMVWQPRYEFNLTKR